MDVISIEENVRSAIARFLAKEIDSKELSDLVSQYVDDDTLSFLKEAERSDLVSIIDQAADMDYLEKEGNPEFAMKTFEVFSKK